MPLRILLIVAAVLFVVPRTWAGDPIDPNNPREGLFSDEWGEVHMAGGKVGYVHSTMTRRGNVIETRMFTKMVVGRAHQAITIQTTASTQETLAGAPLSFSQETDASIMKTAIRGKIEAGRVTVVQSQYGMEQTQAFDFPVGAMMAWGLFRESLIKGFEPGTHYTSSMYSPDMRLDGPMTAQTTIGHEETFDHAGKERRGQRVDLKLQTPMGELDMVSWVDSEGQPIKSVVPMPGLGDIVIVMTDQASALTDFVAPEMFMTTVVKAGRSITPSATQRITYRIKAKSPGLDLGDIPVTGMQTPRKMEDGSIELVITRQEHANKKERAHKQAQVKLAKATAGRNNDLAEYLERNLMMNTDDPALVGLAKRVAGDTTDPYVLADKLRRFVTEYITTKNLSVGFATASETCRTREGDCSEHGVLLAALGRINGLPSRVAVGLAYVPFFGGQKDVFGYHLWTQFHIDGQWVDFDAALRESSCSPTRIAFATSSLKNTGLADLTLPLMTKIGAIDIDIVSIDKSPD